MKSRAVPIYSLFVTLLALLVMSSSCFAEINLPKDVKDNEIVIDSLNIKVGIPAGSQSLSVDDYHLVVALKFGDSDSALDSSVFTLQITPLNIWPSLDDMQLTNANRKASKMGQAQLVTLGQPEKLKVMGSDATANLYLFSFPNTDGILYELVTFKKDGLGFMASYWGPRNKNSQFDRFRKWLSEDIQTIRPTERVSPTLVSDMEKNDAQLFGRSQ